MFYHQQESKVNHLGEKAINSQKTSKIMTFCQNLTSVTSDFYAFLELLLGARYFCPYDPRVENEDKLAFWVNLHFGGKKWLPRFEFGETFSSANFCQNSPPVVPTKKGTKVWDDQRSLRRPKKSKTKKFAILTPSTWPKVQHIMFQGQRSAKDFSLVSQKRAACKIWAKSYGQFSRSRLFDHFLLYLSLIL